MSCADVQTIQAGDGTKSEFSFDFPYLFKSEVKVYFWNRVTKEYDEIAQDGSGWGQAPANTIYPWEISDANPTIVHFTEIDSGGNTAAVPPSPAAAVDPNEETVDNVKIRRETSIDDIRALFNPGSAIRSDDLNKNFEQLRYAIQEGNCQGITDDVYEYLKDNYWDRYDNTLYEDDAWVSDDTKIATTAALDKRFQDEVAETITSSESWPDNDDTIATTAAIDNRIDTAITNDIGTDGTGITVTDDGDGTITLGLGAGSIDFDRIKDVDIITQAEQNAGSPAAADNNLFTALAAARRFDTIVSTTTPSGSDWEVGKSWLQNDADKTFSIWDGDSWEGISSGGTFINQPKVVYVDATNGNDDNDGHRISRPKASIKAAINQINADSTYGDGSIVVVAPGVYREAAPIQIQKRDVSVVGTSLRSCVVHPTEATETNTLFEVNSGTYLKNLTFTGVKASGTRGEAGSLYTDATHGLPATQGWNVAFLAGATIVKSPYIQNCTNFSDSEIDNTDLNFYSGTEDAGRAGDEDSAMTGGGLLVDGSVPAATSPLRSMVCDSYTHVGLDGPGILVTNNGYCQATSSYAFFNHFHIACINGGQANLAASTTDFGRFSLITDGRSPNAIFTSNVDGAADDEAISFNINAPTASTDLYNEAGTENDNAWWGSATRPQPNMLVEVNGVTYPILSATPNTDSEGGAGWTVTISRPDPNNRSTNLGLNGAITDDAAVSFFLRSMIASSGHTMEYVGSGTNYSALPENGGVPNDSNQIIELNNGKVWTAITDHNGKFRIGGNQTTDPIFEVDQQLGFVTIPEGSIAFNLLSDLTPQLGGNLDVNGNTITSTSNADVVIDPNGTGTVDVSTSRITNVTDPTGAQDAATKNYVDTNSINNVVEDTTPQLGGNLDVNGQTITSASNGDILIDPDGTGIISLGSSVGIGTSSPGSRLTVNRVNFADASATGATTLSNAGITVEAATDTNNRLMFGIGSTGGAPWIQAQNTSSNATQSLILNPVGGNVGIGTTSPQVDFQIGNADGSSRSIVIHTVNNGDARLRFREGATVTSGFNEYSFGMAGSANAMTWESQGSGEIGRWDGAGRLLVGTNSALTNDYWTSGQLQVANNNGAVIQAYTFSNSSSNGAAIELHKARGTQASPSNPGSTDILGEINFYGYNSSAATPFQRAAFINARMYGTVASSGDTTDMPGQLNFATSADGSSTPTVKMTILPDGNVGVGASSPDYKLDVNGTVGITEGNPLNWHDGSGGLAARIYGTDSNELRFDVTSLASRALTIDSSGRLLVGTTSARTNVNLQNGDRTPHVQIETSTANYNNGLSIINNSADGYAPQLTLGLSLANGIGSNGNVGPVNPAAIGMLNFVGNDGDQFLTGARIEAVTDGVTGNGDMPGRLVFSTTADGAASPTERMRITNDGYFKFTNSGSYRSATGTYNEIVQGSNLNNLFVRCSNASFTSTNLLLDTVRAANSAYFFLYAASGDSADAEFILRGDGNAYADGSWNGGGADYAEYFEWSDGNTTAEDRRGISVVLDGDKIREAVADEEPIGVISGNPSVVGDAAWNKWNGKYIRDDFGTYIQEDYEVEDEDGNTVVQQRRKLNPDYNPDVEYVSRENRPEWDCVGLMGKLRIRKGQVTGARWIKMRDVSDNVEEWLVR